jgi:hypothetical protein
MSTTGLATFDETTQKTNICSRKLVKHSTATGICHIRHCVLFCIARVIV